MCERKAAHRLTGSSDQNAAKDASHPTRTADRRPLEELHLHRGIFRASADCSLARHPNKRWARCRRIWDNPRKGSQDVFGDSVRDPTYREPSVYETETPDPMARRLQRNQREAILHAATRPMGFLNPNKYFRRLPLSQRLDAEGAEESSIASACVVLRRNI